MAKKKDGVEVILLAIIGLVTAVIVGVIHLITAAVKAWKGHQAQKNTAVPAAKTPPISMSMTVETPEDSIEPEYQPEYTRLNMEKTRSGRLPVHLEFDYVRPGVKPIRRQVDVVKFHTDGEFGQIDGFCHLRKEQRTFNLSNMKNCVDSETGEVVEPIGQWLLNSYDNSSSGQVRAFLEKHSDELRCLLNISKADGSFRQREKIIISNYINSITDDRAMAEECLGYITKHWAQDYIVQHNQALRRLAEQPLQMRQAVYDAMDKIANGDGKADDAEVKALKNAKKLLNI